MLQHRPPNEELEGGVGDAVRSEYHAYLVGREPETTVGDGGGINERYEDKVRHVGKRVEGMADK